MSHKISTQMSFRVHMPPAITGFLWVFRRIQKQGAAIIRRGPSSGGV